MSRGKCNSNCNREPPGCLYKRSDTGGWYWKVRRPGEEKFRYLRMVPRGRRQATKSKKVALICQRRLWSMWTSNGIKDPPSRAIRVWINRFQRWNAGKASERHARYNADVVRRFAKAHQIKRADEILLEDVEAYLLSLKKTLSAGTIHRHLNAISRFCRFLMTRSEPLLDSNPAQLARECVPRIYLRPPRFLTEKGIEDLLNALADAPGWLRTAVRLGLGGGLRVGEIRSLRGRDIDLAGVMVGASKPTKTYQWRKVPIPPDLQAELEAMADGGPDRPIFPQYGIRWWVRMLKRYTDDLPVFGELPGSAVGNQWHLLRNTFAVRRARGGDSGQGATLWELMALLGHSTPQTTMRYINVAHAAGRA